MSIRLTLMLMSMSFIMISPFVMWFVGLAVGAGFLGVGTFSVLTSSILFED